MNRRNLFDSKKVVRRKQKKTKKNKMPDRLRMSDDFQGLCASSLTMGTYARQQWHQTVCDDQTFRSFFFVGILFFSVAFSHTFCFFFSCVFNILSPFSLSLIVCALRRPFSHLLYPLNFILRLCTVMKFVHIEWIVSCVCVSSTNEFCFCRTQNRI